MWLQLLNAVEEEPSFKFKLNAPFWRKAVEQAELRAVLKIQTARTNPTTVSDRQARKAVEEF